MHNTSNDNNLYIPNAKNAQVSNLGIQSTSVGCKNPIYKYPLQKSNPKYLKSEFFQILWKPEPMNQGLGCPNIQILWQPKKSQPGIRKSNPPYLPNGDRLGKKIYTIGLITLENGGG
jgi:hypothetical protein